MSQKTVVRASVALTATLLASAHVYAQEPRPAEIPAERFAQLPLVSGAELSPDGKAFAYLRPIDGRRHLIISSLDGDRPPAVMPPVDQLEFRWLHWASDEHIVFSMSYSALRNLTETTETRLLSVNRDGSNAQSIVRPATMGKTGSRLARTELAPAQLQDKVIDWLPEDPEHILLSIDEDGDNEDEVRRVDITDGSYKLIHDGTRGVQRWMTDTNHDLRIGRGWQLGERHMIVRAGEGRWYEAENQDWWERGFRIEAFTDDPNIAYAIGPTAAGYNAVHHMRVSTGEILEEVFAADGRDVSGLILHPSTREVLGARYTDNAPRRHYFDEDYRRLSRSLNQVFPDTVNVIVSASDDMSRVLVRASSDVVPGDYYLWDRSNRSIDLIAEAMPGLTPELLAPTTSAWVETRDGAQMEVFVTTPRVAVDGPMPAVVLPHGGPASRSNSSFWFLSQFIASRGFVVLQPNFRGSTGYGREFAAAGVKQWGGRMQDDVDDAANWLVEQGLADAERLCIVGWSYGGYSAAIGAIRNPELYRCAVSINAPLNLPRMISEDKRYIGGRTWSRHFGLEEAKASDVSPYHLAESLERPLLIIQAEDDTRVHIEQGEGTYKHMKDLGKDVSYVSVEHGGHSMYNEPARLTILNSVETFLAERIGGD